MLKVQYFVFFLLFSLNLSFSYLAADELEQAQTELSNKITQLNELPRTPETIKQLDSYLQAQNQLDKSEEFRKRAQQYQEITETFSEQVDKLKASIADYSSTEFPDFLEWDKNQLTQEITDQEFALDRIEVRRNNDKSILLDIEHGVNNFSYQSEVLRKKIARVEEELAQLQVPHSDKIAEDELLLLKIEDQFYLSQSLLLEAEQLSSGHRRTLTKLTIDYSNLEIEAHQAYNYNLKNMLNRILRSSAETSVEMSNNLEGVLSDHPPVLRQLITVNQSLSAALSAFSNKREQVQDQIEATYDQVGIVAKTSEDLDMMSEWLKLNPALSENLRSRINRLPANPPIEELNKSIAQNQLNKYEYQQQLLTISQRERYDKEIGFLTVEQQKRAESLITENLSLLNEVITASDELIDQQAILTVSYDRINNMLNDLKAEATKRLFWAPDVKVISMNLITETWVKLQWFFSPFQWLNIVKAPMAIETFKLVLGLTIISFILISLSWFRKRWVKYLEK
ncbi:MAG: hypothetical protein V7782_12450, partial [Psychromonas sp.]